MIDADLRLRVQRLLRGGRRPDDLDRIFLGIRDRAGMHASVREVGDFVAHRDQREKGPATQQACGVQISFRTWLRIRGGVSFTMDDMHEVSSANLRIATDEQLMERLGRGRSSVRQILKQAFTKLEKGKRASDRERQVFDYMCGAFIWNPAFTDIGLMAGLSIELPIFDSGRRRATVRLEDVRSREAALDYRRTVLSALHEVDDALAAYGADQARREALIATVAHDRDAVGLGRQRYASGVGSFIDVLDAERTLEQNELLLADASMAVSADLVVLYKTLGGGWSASGSPGP